MWRTSVNTSDATKAANERAAFVDFARAARLSAAPASIEVRRPPEPDVLCALGGRPYRFELGRLIDQSIPDKVQRSLRQKPRNKITGGAYSGSKPIEKMLREKLANHYETSGAPLDLLLYYDSDGPAAHQPPPEFDEWARLYALPILNEADSARTNPFSRVWFFDRNTLRVL